jgi:hypothetical protein
VNKLKCVVTLSFVAVMSLYSSAWKPRAPLVSTLAPWGSSVGWLKAFFCTSWARLRIRGCLANHSKLSFISLCWVNNPTNHYLCVSRV